MAFLDKLKGVADKAKEAAERAAAVAKEKIEQQQQAAQQAEADRKAEAEQKAEEKRTARLDELKKNMIDTYRGHPDAYAYWASEFNKIASAEEAKAFKIELEAMKEAEEKAAEEAKTAEIKALVHALNSGTNCDAEQGDCFWLGEKFFCTCGEDVDCPKKKYVKKTQRGNIHALEHVPYIKYLAQFEKQADMFDESRYDYVNKGNGTMGYTDALREFFKAFLPEHVGNVATPRVFDFFYEHGLGDDNPVMRILYTVHEQTEGKIMPWIPDLTELYREGIDLEQPFFNNVSLYDRNLRDFRYTVKILDAASDPIKMVEKFAHPERVDVEALFNADGTIKATGYGGPKAGFYGDEIYNIVSTWNEEE